MSLNLSIPKQTFLPRKKIMLRALAAAVFVSGLVACSSNSIRQPVALTEVLPSVNISKAWQVSLNGSSSKLFYLASEGEFLYAATEKGVITKIDAITGKELWQTRVDEDLSAAVTVNRGKIAAADVKGNVYLLEADTGKVSWKYQINAEILQSPVFADDMMVVHANNNRVYALDVVLGKLRWQQQHLAEKLSVRAPSGMLVANDKVYIGYAGGRMIALQLKNGVPIWDTQIARAKGSNELERITMPVGLPRINRQQGICSASYQGQVSCADPETGQIVWSKSLSSATGVSLDGDLVYASDERSVVHALKFGTQNSLWQQDKLLYRDVTVPTPFRNYVVVGDRFGIVHVLANSDGRFLNRFATDGSAIIGEPLVVTDNIVVQTAKGNVFALKIEDMQ